MFELATEDEFYTLIKKIEHLFHYNISYQYKYIKHIFIL
jgi:hypothetical protein